MNILKIEDFINEGAGAGYTVKFEGIEIDWDTAKPTGNKYTENNSVYIEYTADIKGCILDKWSAAGYYDGVTSDGIEYNGDIIMDYGDEDKQVKSGKITCLIDTTDVAEYKRNSIPVNNADVIRNLCKDYYESTINVEYMHGAGWVHSDMKNPITIGDFDTKRLRTRDCLDITPELMDSYGNYYSYVKNITLDADNIVKDINWYFANCDNFDEMVADE